MNRLARRIASCSRATSQPLLTITTRSSSRIARLTRNPYVPGRKITQMSVDTWTPKPLDYNAGPMVWIDCEMTGLNPPKDKILEIAVIITNGQLQPVDEGIRYAVRTDKKVLDGMDEWCTNQHGKSGLTAECLTAPHTLSEVEKMVLAYIKKWVPQQRTALLAGNSVHADRSFMVHEMPKVIDWLHYRIVDVSSVKELARRWYPDNPVPKELFGGNHRALDDIQGSIIELQWYRDNIFKPAK
ncbi:ribonuclease H-like protein [Coniophora puteana RWD-64-598 SS2]|uniref:Ribonuclease H-like protein n=1 Tax=Coniophora puteana (strain RWD-64-598) TaxID=741705 RepID=A0A5M3MQ55_CONPW|nr:ribonuclease H-like protein [Coniophora puteana RWD-64-598 SS2]EIW80691.1 ribonuclease H-like protein [Coniophora puteana RWD-64-598 SS2]